MDWQIKTKFRTSKMGTGLPGIIAVIVSICSLSNHALPCLMLISVDEAHRKRMIARNPEALNTSNLIYTRPYDLHQIIIRSRFGLAHLFTTRRDRYKQNN